jgi:NAD(P)-dependent dehydrogenase (short-subunit alcohol dehydrogenase family)
LGDKGFELGLVARSADALEETRELVERRGARAVSVVADVTDPEAVHHGVETIEQRLGPIAVLVNNAGQLRAIGPLWEVSAEDWWADLKTSLGGAVVLCREVVPRMIERGDGRIVNLTSYAAVRPAPYETGYACAKAGVASLTEALGASLADYGIKAFAVAPGFTLTEMTRHLAQSEAGRRWLPEAGRRRGLEVERSAELIVTLASGGADELSGRILHTLDDVPTLLANVDEIRRDDLYVPRVRRLPSAR